MAVHLSSHNCPIETSDALVIWGKVCACFTLLSNEGWSGIVPLFVAWITVLSGIMYFVCDDEGENTVE
eukprot:5811281-Ditylum_brightwellii.AAC.1